MRAGQSGLYNSGCVKDNTGSVKYVVRQHLSKYVAVVDASSYASLDTIFAYKVKFSNYYSFYIIYCLLDIFILYISS